MKAMNATKRILVVSTLAFVITGSLNASADTVGVLSLKECGAMTASPVLRTALNNVLSLGYVRHAVEVAQQENVQGAELCYSGLAFHKNIYQYYQFFIEIRVKDSASQKLTHKFHLLYQDASTQANHNTTRNAWVGLDREVVAQAFTEGMSDLLWKEVTAELSTGLSAARLMELSDLAKAAQVRGYREESLSSWAFSFGATESLLMTWMRPNGQGVFSGAEIPEGIALQRDASDGHLYMADVTWLQSRFLYKLEEEIFKGHDTIPYENYSQQLLKLSRIPVY